MEIRKREILHYKTENGTDMFTEWFEGLRDGRGQAAILKRLDRVEEGLLGDHQPVGEGVWELRIDVGPGYRVYYGEQGRMIVVLLVGGNKRSQRKDIRKAQGYWMAFRRNQ